MPKRKGLLSFLRRLFGSDSDNAKAESVASLMEILAQPDNPNLADDEEERIFKDPTTGHFYTEVVKIDGKKVPTANSASRYPDPMEIPLEEADQISVQHNGKSYQLWIHHRATGPEEDDIIQSSSGDESHLIHPGAIFDQVLSSPGVFVSDIPGDKADQLSHQACLRVKFMDDSREYHDISIGQMQISVPGKYLGLYFYLFTCNDDLLVATKHLLDENADEVPVFLTTLQKEFISSTSAVFEQDDEMWYYRSP